MKILQSFFVLVLTVICYSTVSAQVKIGDNVSTINAASLLELESTDQGVLMPRLTTAQRDAQNSWAEGHVIYNTTESCFQFFDGTLWKCLGAQEPDVTSNLPFSITSTVGNCKISDYIPEGAADTTITESRKLTLVSAQSNNFYMYEHSPLNTAMTNNTIIGFRTDNRPLGNSIAITAHIYFALPDANRHIGKTFLLYTIPDSFMPTSNMPNFQQLFSHVNRANGSFLASEHAEDEANDHIHFDFYRAKLYNEPPLGSFPTLSTTTDHLRGSGDPAHASHFKSHWMIITVLGPDDWKFDCSGHFLYPNPF